MTFEEYIRLVVPKIGPNAAFDLSRDARLQAIENILAEKEIASKEEFEAEVEKRLGESAENIMKMPPIPNPKQDDSFQQKK